MGSDVLVAIALGRLAPVLYLGKKYGAVFLGNDINLADPGFPIAANDFMAVVL